jgi:hypothetical protein
MYRDLTEAEEQLHRSQVQCSALQKNNMRCIRRVSKVKIDNSSKSFLCNYHYQLELVAKERKT